MKALLAMTLLCVFSSAEASDLSLACLPKDVTPDTLVSRPVEAVKGESQKLMTVRAAIQVLGGHCREGKLFDKSGQEIRFFHLIGCWGNPPADYQELLALQAQEIQRLKMEKVTVVEIPCAQLDPRQIY